LKALRHQLAYAQRDMAHAMGISRSYYADLECGRQRITDELEMLATTYAAIRAGRTRRQHAVVAEEDEEDDAACMTRRWRKHDPEYIYQVLDSLCDRGGQWHRAGDHAGDFDECAQYPCMQLRGTMNAWISYLPRDLGNLQ
jgi:transcriptional regulator with XRE-family HTH domain